MVSSKGQMSMICINNFQNILEKRHWDIYDKAVVLVMYCLKLVPVAVLSYRNLTVGFCFNIGYGGL
jgi:hypothetical protein